MKNKLLKIVIIFFIGMVSNNSFAMHIKENKLKSMADTGNPAKKVKTNSIDSSNQAKLDSATRVKDFSQLVIDSLQYITTKAKSTNNFSVKIFSDLQGLNKNQPNSLLQTEINFHWNLNPFPTWHVIKDPVDIIFLKNLILPEINVFQSKKDSSLQFTPLHHTLTGNPDSIYIHTLNIVKYASYSFSGYLNLFTIQSRDKDNYVGFLLYVDLFGAFYATGVHRDSLLLAKNNIKAEDKDFQIYSVGLGYNIKLQISPPHSNASIQASYKEFGLKLISNDVKQNYGKLYTPDYDKRNDDPKNIDLAPANNINFGSIAMYNISIRYSSVENKFNSGNTGIFFNFSFYTNPLFSGRGKNDFGNNYMQMQVGMIKTLTDFLKILKF